MSPSTKRILVTLLACSVVFVAVTLAVQLTPDRKFSADRYAVSDSPQCAVKYFLDGLASPASD